MFNIETVIFIYMFVCVSVIVFNVWSVISLEIEARNDKKRKQWIKKTLAREQQYPNQYQNEIFKKLRSIEYLNFFVEEVLQLSEKQKKDYLSRSLDMFNQLVADYQTKEDIMKACFAYNISRLHLCDYNNEKISQMMLQMILSESPYCRENALKALYESHDVNLIIKAILLLNRFHIYHYDKLLIDGVLSFKGDKRILGYELLGIYPELSYQYRTIIIQILSGIGNDYCREIYQLYQVGYHDVDLNVSIIRYFGRWIYEPFQDVLYQTVCNESCDWELRAVSAYALRSYHNDRTISLLKQATNDTNWYVRYNSAESLTDILKGEENAFIEIGDQYAQDIIRYMRQKNVLRKGDI